jgi:hypothetical protein
MQVRTIQLSDGSIITAGLLDHEFAPDDDLDYDDDLEPEEDLVEV